MHTSRRTFIRNLGLASAGLMAPSLLVNNSEALAGFLDSKQKKSGFKIVDNGEACAVIVKANSASSVPEYASQELQWHIEKATGVQLNIIPEQDAAASSLPRIYVGPSAAAEAAGVRVDKLPLNGFRSKATKDSIYLAGKDDQGRPDDAAFGSGHWAAFETGELPLDDTVSMGTLFAVYDWLETQLNVLWIWPDETGVVVSSTKVLFSGVIGEKTVKPALLFAQARLNTWAGMDPLRQPQYVHDTSAWMRRQRIARGIAIGGSGQGHAFNRYWKRFGETHPEYFALLPNGKRQPFNPKRPNLVQMCVSNAGFHQQVIADWLKQREEIPSRQMILGAENDRTAMDPPCQCDNCRAWDPPNPQPPLVRDNPWLSGNALDNDWKQISVSDRYAKFWLALQKEGQKHDPNASVLALAYTDYSDPPVETKLNKNIMIGIVPAYAYPMSRQEAAEFKKVWDGWEATGATIYLRPNNFLTGYDLPHVYPHQFGNDFKHALQNGLVGTDFDSLVGMWGVQGINLYMMGRLTAHPEMSVEQVLHEYYSAFGSAAHDIQKYFEHWEKVTSKITTQFREDAHGGWSPLSRAGDAIYTTDTFIKGKRLLKKARDNAKLDHEVQARIDYLDLWLEHADLTMQTLSAYRKHKAEPTDERLKVLFEQARMALIAYRETHADKIVNVGFLDYLERW